MKIEIDKIIDIDKNKIHAIGPIDIKGIYANGRWMYQACRILPEGEIQAGLSTLWSHIRVAYFLQILKEGGVLAPIILEGNTLVDGGHRLRAHILHGSKEIEYIQGDMSNAHDGAGQPPCTKNS